MALQAKSLPLRWIAGVRQCRTPLCPPIQVAKAHFGDFAGTAEKGLCSPFSIFHIRPIGKHRLRVSWLGTFMRDALKNLSLGRYA